MQITKITNDNKIIQNKILAQKAIVKPITMGSKEISFKGLNPASQEILQNLGFGIFKVIKTNMAIDRAHGFLYKNNIIDGLEMAIGLNEKIGTSKLRHFSDFEGLLERSSKYAEKLPDTEFVNRDIKRRFLRSVFLRKIPTHLMVRSGSGPVHGDKIPKQAKTLFINLNNSIHGDFKQDLVQYAIVKDNINISNPFELLAGLELSATFKDNINAGLDVCKNRIADIDDTVERIRAAI